jgi:MFS transporter, DHA1 family, multidrug resistance protein
VYGPISDQFGRRLPLLSGIVVFLIGSLICATAASAPLLLIGRVIQGIGACTGVVLGRAMVRDVYPADRAAAVLAYVSMALVAFSALSPLIGGALLAWWSWRMPFFFTAAGAAVMFAIALRLSETLHSTTRLQGLSSLLRDFGVLLRMPEFAVPAAAVALSNLGFYAFVANAPIMAEELFRIPPQQYGFYFAVLPIGFCLGSFLSTRAIPLLGLQRAAIWGVAGTAVVACTLLGAAVLTDLPAPALFVFVGVINIATAISLPALTVCGMGANRNLIGAASGLIGFLQMAAGAGATQVIAYAYDGTPVPIAALLATSTTLAAIVLLANRRWRRGGGVTSE